MHVVTRAKLLLAAFACLAFVQPAEAQYRGDFSTIEVGPGGIKCKAGATCDASGLSVGGAPLSSVLKRESNKTIITPDTLRILGAGSTGDASAFTVLPPNSSTPTPLSTIAANAPQITGGVVSLRSGQLLGNIVDNNFRIGPTIESVAVESFNAPPNYSADATDSFRAALNGSNVTEVTFCGKYAVRGLVIPDGKRLRGCSTAGAVLMAAGSGGADFVVEIHHASHASDFTINGNNSVAKGLAITGVYSRVSNVLSMYSTYCFHNTLGNNMVLDGNGHQNCKYGFYSADHWVNSIIINHIGRNGNYDLGVPGPSYGFYWTYSTQQPQAVRVVNSQSYGDTFGVWFEKDAFSVNLENMVIDHVGDTGITFNNIPCVMKDGPADIYISGNFIGGRSRGIQLKPQVDGCAQPRDSYVHVVIQKNRISGIYGLLVEANASSRLSSISVLDNTFGPTGIPGDAPMTSIQMDSVYGAWIERNSFAKDPNNVDTASVDIATLATFTGTAYTTPINPPVQVRYNRFERSGTRISPFNTVASDNIGGP